MIPRPGAYIAEFVATFALVFAGTGAVIIDAQSGGAIGHPGISVTFGLVVMTMIYTIGDVSGAHINPAVTIAFWLEGRLPAIEVPLYVLAQVLGGCAASGLLFFLFPDSATFGATVPSGSAAQTFYLEIVLSFFLMLVILGVATGSKEKGVMAGVAIGGVVCMCAMFGGPISGASMNPARSIGPALVEGTFDTIWLYIAAPIIGCGLSVPAYRSFQWRLKAAE